MRSISNFVDLDMGHFLPVVADFLQGEPWWSDLGVILHD